MSSSPWSHFSFLLKNPQKKKKILNQWLAQTLEKGPDWLLKTLCFRCLALTQGAGLREMVCLLCNLVSLVVQVVYGWSMLGTAATREINIQPILHRCQLRSLGRVWVRLEKKAPFPSLHKGGDKGWDFSKFLPKHTASFICHSKLIYFYQIYLVLLTTQCICFCGLYLEKSLIFALENWFILQCLLVGLCTSLLLWLFPPCLFLWCRRWNPGSQAD